MVTGNQFRACPATLFYSSQGLFTVCIRHDDLPLRRREFRQAREVEGPQAARRRGQDMANFGRHAAQPALGVGTTVRGKGRDVKGTGRGVLRQDLARC